MLKPRFTNRQASPLLMRGMGMLLAGVTLAHTVHAQGTASSDFVVGTLLPLTGPAALFGPGMSAAVELAARDINAAGGVLGRKVAVIGADDAGDASIASQALDRLLSQGAKALMGTGSTGVTLALLDKVVRARVSMCAGANTGPELSTAPHEGYYARTSYSNALQGPVLGQRSWKTVTRAWRCSAAATPLAEA